MRGLPIADLQSYGQSALTLFERLISTMQTKVKAVGGLPGPVLIATGAGCAAALLLGGVILLRVRARREKRKFEEELRKLDALKQAAESANQAKAEFLGSMGHWIRTPVNAIVGFTDLALKTDLDRDLRECLDTVRTSADWLMRIANDVLEFSRIEAGRLQLQSVPFSISECMLSAIKIVEREASAKKLAVSCKIDPQLPEAVCGDPARLRDVIFNLLDYAVRFTTGGSVMLSAAVESNSGNDVLVRITVRDTGVGIPPAKRSLIFEPFRHAEGGAALTSGATGLGLAISRRLAELMGGTMEFQSQLGAGSTFEFTARFEKVKTPAELDGTFHAPESTGLKKLSIFAGGNAGTAHADGPVTALDTEKLDIGRAEDSYIPEGDAVSSSDFVPDGAAQNLDAIPYLLASVAEADESVLEEVDRSAEIISILARIEASNGNSEDSGPAADVRVSAPVGLALLQAATCQSAEQLPVPAKREVVVAPTAGWNPFEQARESLSKSRFDVRVIHNDGDPSDRNLI